jgi:uncharacterized membrane protein YciS (DUF1049 family)
VTTLRKLHLAIGFSLVPLVIIQAVTGLLLRLRLAGGPLHTLHTWFKYQFAFTRAVQVAGTVLGVLTAVGLLYLAVSGSVLYLNMRISQARRRRKAHNRAEG